MGVYCEKFLFFTAAQASMKNSQRILPLAVGDLKWAGFRCSSQIPVNCSNLLLRVLQKLLIDGEAVEGGKIILRGLRPSDLLEASVLMKKDFR